MKITKTTFKTFLKKNAGSILIQKKRSFDGMVDGCVESDVKGFHPVVETTDHAEHTFGISGAWLVGHGGDRFLHFEADGLVGIEVYNCCGSFVLAIKKA